MSDREQILAKLQNRVRPARMPEPWRSRRDYADLVATFIEAFRAAGGEAKRMADLHAAQVEISAILEEVEAENVLLNGDLSLALESEWPHIGWFKAGQTVGDLGEFAQRADVGISGVVAALAETGSLVVSSGPQLSRMASLLPPVHIALVPRSAITPDIFTWTAARDGQMPTNVVLISGPSKSADIGMTLTTGVHGPGRIIALIYDG